MEISALLRYPVKSMLGESLDHLVVDAQGAQGDRGLALVDVETGRVATAKHPRLWRGLLKLSASGDPGQVRIGLPDGRQVASQRDGIDELLSELLRRRVRLASERAEGAEVERPAPEDVLERGVDAEVDFVTLAISGATAGKKFVDHSPLHLMTTATLEHIGAEAIRYRPNLVLTTPPGQRPFAETDWVGHELRVGGVRLRVTLPTPRCAVPTLEHGDLPRAPHAVRIPMAQNRVEVPDFGTLPCAGVYLDVLQPGHIATGDKIELG